MRSEYIPVVNSIDSSVFVLCLGMPEILEGEDTGEFIKCYSPPFDEFEVKAISIPAGSQAQLPPSEVSSRWDTVAADLHLRVPSSFSKGHEHPMAWSSSSINNLDRLNWKRVLGCVVVGPSTSACPKGQGECICSE